MPSNFLNNVEALETREYWILDALSDLGVIVCDMEGRITYYNATASLNDGLDRAEVVGKNYRDIYKSASGGCIAKCLRTRQPIYYDISQYEDKSSRNRHSFDSAYPIVIDGEMRGVLALTRYPAHIKTFIQKSNELRNYLSMVELSTETSARYTFKDIVGQGPAFVKAIERARKAAHSNAPVLIYGETGTGKELVAQSIHSAGAGSGKPFVGINCAAIPDSLLESTLFGTVKGAFTNAENMQGLFELAEDGTVFLDEINSMSLHLQAKLLRVLQEKRVRRLGAKEEYALACRVISSCNQPPRLCIEKQLLRQDLYFRLAVVYIEIPPLRERTEDVELLARHFIGIHLGAHYGIEDEFIGALKRYSWPGNTRELEHVVESASIMLEPGEPLAVRHVTPYLCASYEKEALRGQKRTLDGEGSLQEQLLATEKAIIQDALEQCDGNVTRAAERIGISRSNLQYRMRKLGL